MDIKILAVPEGFRYEAVIKMVGTKVEIWSPVGHGFLPMGLFFMWYWLAVLRITEEAFISLDFKDVGYRVVREKDVLLAGR